MRQLRAWFLRLGGLFRGERGERDLAEEMNSLVQMHLEANLRAGLTHKEARRLALIEIGGVEAIKEKYRDRRTLPWIETLARDVRYGVRLLRKNPGFAAVAVLTLGLGIGANTAIFSVVNAVLLRPLPYADSERLVQIRERDMTRGIDLAFVSFPNFHDWREQCGAFERMAAYRYALLDLTSVDRPEALLGLRVSADLFPMLGIAPVVGRTFIPEEDQPGHEREVILSYDLWSRVFNRERELIGKSIVLGDETYTVVGVMPARFNFPLTTPLAAKMAFWVPLAETIHPEQRDWNSFGVLARLKPGVSLQTASAEMEVIASALEQQYPVQDRGLGAHLELLREDVVGKTRPALLVFVAAVALVLLIACANVAGLLAARATTRQREIALRSALGASRGRVVRQLLTECLLIAVIGGLVGIVVAVSAMRLLVAITPANVPRLAEVSFDGGILAYMLALSVLSGLLFGLAPALAASRLDLIQALKGEGINSTATMRHSALRNALVIGEMALSLSVLVGSGLLFRSFVRLERVDPGFRPDHLVSATIGLSGARYRDPSTSLTFFEQVLNRAQALPGVSSVGAIDYLPLTGTHAGGPFIIEGQPTETDVDSPVAYRFKVTPDYFRTMGISLVAGRTFSDHDRAGAPLVAVVSEATVRQYWPGESPVGRRLGFGFADKPYWFEIVGVVGDIRHDGLDVPASPIIYLPYVQLPERFMVVVARTSAEPASLAPALRGAVAEVDKEQPILKVQTMDDLYQDAVAVRRFNLMILAVFGALALILAAIGNYGVMAYVVAMRTHEIGVRMALGARPRDVVGLVVGRALGLSLTGTALGLGGSLVLTRFMSGLLFEVRPDDPATFIAVSLLLMAVALAASFVPARRAVRIDPMAALRHE